MAKVEEWKKVAAQVAGTTADIERAFADQAFNLIQNKAAPLMKPQFRVGFEIVFKNDDNTRMVGIFVFRVNQDRYYAPVFFINGNIKGTDLLYRCTPKRFVPMTNDWVEYLVALSQAPEGHGIPMSDRRLIRNQLNLQDIVEPPISRGTSMHKFASFAAEGDKLDGTFQEWLDSVKMASEPKESILQRFIEEDGGFNAIQKLANTTQANRKFCRALFTLCKPDDYAPQLEVSVKKASVTTVLAFHQQLVKNANVQKITEADMVKGYLIEDNRKEANVNEAVFSANTQDYSTVTEPGIFQVLLQDGTTHEMLCSTYKNLGVGSRISSDKCCAPPTPYYGDREVETRFVLIDKNDDASTQINFRHQTVMGKYIGDIDGEKIGVSTPEAGKGYRIYNGKSKTFSEPFWVESVGRSPGGLTEVTCSDDHYPMDGKFWAGAPILLNPDYDDCDTTARVYGKHCVFVPVASKKEDKRREFVSDIPLGDSTSLNQMIFEQGYKRASVRKAPQGYYTMHTNEVGRWTPELDHTVMKLHLMVKCAMREHSAEEVLASADQAGKFEFYYLPNTKLATNLRFDHWPEFNTTVSNDFNVQEEMQPSHVMAVDRDEQYMEPQRIGDRMSMETPDTPSTDQLDTMSPMQLSELSQQRGNSALFEHGVVGSLTNTYDSMAMVDKWLPDMEKALDAIGRTLFLFYWKPEDFAQAYGTDDQSQLENKLVSNFKSFGDLVIEMLQKSKQNAEGSVSLT